MNRETIWRAVYEAEQKARKLAEAKKRERQMWDDHYAMVQARRNRVSK